MIHQYVKTSDLSGGKKWDVISLIASRCHCSLNQNNTCVICRAIYRPTETNLMLLFVSGGDLEEHNESFFPDLQKKHFESVSIKKKSIYLQFDK